MAKKFKKKHRYVSKEAKREKRMKFTMSVILAGLMFISVFSMGASYFASKKIEYNDLKFKQEETEQGFIYTTKINDEKIFLYSLPNISMNLPVEGNMNILRDKPSIIFTVNPTIKLASYVDLLRYEYSGFSNVMYIPAVDGEYNITELKIATCENATAQMPIVHFKETNESSIFKVEDNCVTIEANEQEIVYIRDRLIMSILGIAIE